MAGFTYKSYSFIDKDPMIDQIRTVIQESGMTYYAIAEASGVTMNTIKNWLDGATRRPQAATFNAVLRACGYKLTIRPIAEAEIISMTLSMRHVVQINKYKRKASK